VFAPGQGGAPVGLAGVDVDHDPVCSGGGEEAEMIIAEPRSSRRLSGQAVGHRAP
jgi:hypothetical protein